VEAMAARIAKMCVLGFAFTAEGILPLVPTVYTAIGEHAHELAFKWYLLSTPRVITAGTFLTDSM
jgi:hypothetical protein